MSEVSVKIYGPEDKLPLFLKEEIATGTHESVDFNVCAIVGGLGYVIQRGRSYAVIDVKPLVGETLDRMKEGEES